jgi:hypothetical protein
MDWIENMIVIVCMTFLVVMLIINLFLLFGASEKNTQHLLWFSKIFLLG